LELGLAVLAACEAEIVPEGSDPHATCWKGADVVGFVGSEPGTTSVVVASAAKQRFAALLAT
jgi:hypothetical protein